MTEEQTEELEALLSIYEGDEKFKQVNANTFQYLYGKEDNPKSFLVEIQWTETYPAEVPIVKMDTFYNRNLLPAIKEKISTILLEEAAQWLGCGMTYTLFECLKDRTDELLAEQLESTTAAPSIEWENGISAIKISDNADGAKKKEQKKEQLTKSQKRRQWEQTDHKGERPRGWNWVDIVKHLSQTGSKGDPTDEGPCVISNE